MAKENKKVGSPHQYVNALQGDELLNICNLIGVSDSKSLRALVSQKELKLSNTQICKLMGLNRVTYQRFIRILNDRIRKGIGA